jgi:FKBP-type peptidyl-prolyl cis-trans isomerase FklB
MRFFALPVLLLALALPLAAQSPADQTAADTSYGLGMYMAESIKNAGLDVAPQDFLAGLTDVLSGKATRLTQAQAESLIQAAVMAVQAKKAQATLAEGQAFLDANKAKPGVKVTASGLQYEVLTLGTGPLPKITDTVTVNYEGRLIDGKVFDSSYERNEPASFGLGQVIKGWTEGLQLMPVGSKFRFCLPPQLAYGDQSAGDDIGPNSVLVFEVELLSIDAK